MADPKHTATPLNTCLQTAINQSFPKNLWYRFLYKHRLFFQNFQICRPEILQPLVVQIHIRPLWKDLYYGCLKAGDQGRGSVFKVCHTLLKNANLLHKMANEIKHLSMTIFCIKKNASDKNLPAKEMWKNMLPNNTEKMPKFCFKDQKSLTAQFVN